MKSKKVLQTLLLCTVLFVSWFAEARTGMSDKRSLEKMAAASDHIVIARTVATNSYYGPKRQMIYTDATLEITETIKGRLQKNERIQITLWGGTVNGITTFVLDYPQFNFSEKWRSGAALNDIDGINLTAKNDVW